jgi:quercetin dioxygenase-like cupin family protein
MEIIRLVLPKDKKIATHTVPGEITVQCIEGKVAFTALEQTFDMEPSRMLYLTAGQPHSLRAVEDSSLLVTILLPKS